MLIDAGLFGGIYWVHWVGGRSLDSVRGRYMADTEVKSCGECGASVYPEHISDQKAGFWGGKLLCVHCFAEHRSAQVTIEADDFASPGVVTEPAPGQPAAAPTDDAPVADEPLDDVLDPDFESDDAGLAEELPESEADANIEGQEISLASIAPTMIKPMSSTGITGGVTPVQHKFKRHLQHQDKSAIRCRIFHAKLNEGALQFMQDQINEWIDQSPEVDVKNVSTNVGVMEGKTTQPHLIITIFY